MNLPEPIEKLKDIKNANWIGLAITVTLNVLLMIGTLFMDPETGYYVLMVGLVAITFSVLYIFGWREGKKLAAVGIVLFILMGAIWGPMTVHKTYSMDEPEPVSSAAHVNWFTKKYTVLNTSSYEAGGEVYAEDIGIFTNDGHVYGLDNGGLSPYKGDAGQGYNFTITVYSDDTFQDEPDITVTYALGVQGTLSTQQLTEADPADIEYADGKEFYCLAEIDDKGIYSHVFSLNFEGTQPHSLNTTVALGPLVGEESANYLFYMAIGIPSMFCNIGMLFVILVLLYWWIGTAKEKRKSWDLDLKEKEDEEDEDKPFTCDKCGAGVGVDDRFCPKCGERFDDDDDDNNQGTIEVERGDVSFTKVEQDRQEFVVKEIHTKETIREIVRLPCKYCGSLNENTAKRCEQCGAILD